MDQCSITKDWKSKCPSIENWLNYVHIPAIKCYGDLKKIARSSVSIAIDIYSWYIVTKSKVELMCMAHYHFCKWGMSWLLLYKKNNLGECARNSAYLSGAWGQVWESLFTVYLFMLSNEWTIYVILFLKVKKKKKTWWKSDKPGEGEAQLVLTDWEDNRREWKFYLPTNFHY